MPDTYQAQLGDYNLDIQDIEDSFEKAIAKYEFPYSDGALLEDMGQKARKIKFRCYFYNDTYQTHFDLIDFLKSQSLTDLVHPKYGLIKGYIETLSVRHDDRQQTAEIDITFVENLRGSAHPIAVVQVQRSTEDFFTSGQQEQMDWFSAQTTQALGAEAPGILQKVIDFTQPVLSQFNNISIKARGYVAQVDTYVRMLEGTLLDIRNPANGLISVISYGERLPGRVIGALAKTIERYALLYNTAACAPRQFLSNLQRAISTLPAASGQFASYTNLPQPVSAPSGQFANPQQTISTLAAVSGQFAGLTRCAGAQRLALETSYIYAQDEVNYRAQKQSEGQTSFDNMGNYVKLAPTVAASAVTPVNSPASTSGAGSVVAVLTENDLESTLALTRSAIEGSIRDARSAGVDMPSLKSESLALLSWVESVKMERANIIQVSVSNPTPLHLICLQNDLPYNAAERVYSINKIQQPNFTQGSVNIYAG